MDIQADRDRDKEVEGVTEGSVSRTAVSRQYLLSVRGKATKHDLL